VTTNWFCSMSSNSRADGDVLAVVPGGMTAHLRPGRELLIGLHGAAVAPVMTIARRR
jgi:hypothetical protein